MPLVLVARAVAFFPWSWLRRAGRLIGALAGSVLRIRRREVEASLVRSGFAGAPSIARSMYASLGAALLEFLWIVGRRDLPPVRLSARAERVLAERGGRGLVVATAHTGNWDLVACAAAKRHVPLAVVTKRLTVGFIDRFWQRERAAWGIELLHGEGAFGAAARAIAAGRAVALLVDQAPERRAATMRVSFMGEAAYCDLMPALLAARTGAPLALALGLREPDGTHTIDVPVVLEPPPRPSRAWIESATRSLNSAVESFVRAHPAQWLWLHRRWKELPSPRAPGRPPRGLLSLST